ncbi:hypothetical protein [Pectobacterium fontis]|uniref:Antibiotic biosynthesis monooxygenase n=1 Tax=Pectobacterium fontis TaxID=2558042 RepID=A0A7V8IG96_9GAMM|nr:hypothetical protein [Pectobacterium fontis]KHN49798.1 hypothetical protein OI69_16860 [Pectobacterium fontis]
MIVRTWHGCVPLEYAEGFAVHLQLTGIKHSQSIKGNLGAFVKRVVQGDWEHFFLATYWTDIDAVKAFAGEDYHIAVNYAEDDKFCLLSDPYVFQHDVQSIQAL